MATWSAQGHLFGEECKCLNFFNIHSSSARHTSLSSCSRCGLHAECTSCAGSETIVCKGTTLPSLLILLPHVSPFRCLCRDATTPLV